MISIGETKFFKKLGFILLISGSITIRNPNNNEVKYGTPQYQMFEMRRTADDSAVLTPDISSLQVMQNRISY